jgi:hypothetical protein
MRIFFTKNVYTNPHDTLIILKINTKKLFQNLIFTNFTKI